MPEPNEVVFSCRTLTPIWTGDIDRDSAQVKESGILGSLRFWYEGLLRLHGVRVCGALGQDEKCDCDVCDLFGKTGQARKFRLTVDGLDPKHLFFQAHKDVVATHGAYLYSVFTGEKMSAYVPKMSFELDCLWAAKGPFNLQFGFRAGVDGQRCKTLLTLLLHELSTKGGIGAKTQLGFGQIEVLPPEDGDLQELLDYARLEMEQMQQQRPATNAPSATEGFTLHPDRFFSVVFEGILPPEYIPSPRNEIDIGLPAKIPGRPFVPCAFDIRYSRKPYIDPDINAGLRPRFKADFPGSALDMLGYVRDGEGFGSRVHVSHLYKQNLSEEKYRLKIWGDVSDPQNVRKTVVDLVNKVLRMKPVS